MTLTDRLWLAVGLACTVAFVVVALWVLAGVL